MTYVFLCVLLMPLKLITLFFLPVRESNPGLPRDRRRQTRTELENYELIRPHPNPGAGYSRAKFRISHFKQDPECWAKEVLWCHNKQLHIAIYPCCGPAAVVVGAAVAALGADLEHVLHLVVDLLEGWPPARLPLPAVPHQAAYKM